MSGLDISKMEEIHPSSRTPILMGHYLARGMTCQTQRRETRAMSQGEPDEKTLRTVAQTETQVRGRVALRSLVPRGVTGVFPAHLPGRWALSLARDEGRLIWCSEDAFCVVEAPTHSQRAAWVDVPSQRTRRYRILKRLDEISEHLFAWAPAIALLIMAVAFGLANQSPQLGKCELTIAAFVSILAAVTWVLMVLLLITIRQALALMRISGPLERRQKTDFREPLANSHHLCGQCKSLSLPRIQCQGTGRNDWRVSPTHYGSGGRGRILTRLHKSWPKQDSNNLAPLGLCSYSTGRETRLFLCREPSTSLARSSYHCGRIVPHSSSPCVVRR